MEKLENLGKRLSKYEQKKIIGGDPPGGGSCPGILECVPTAVGDRCPDVGSSTDCTCREDPQDGKMCLP